MSSFSSTLQNSNEFLFSINMNKPILMCFNPLQWLLLLVLNMSHIWPVWASRWHDPNLWWPPCHQGQLHIPCYMVLFSGNATKRPQSGSQEGFHLFLLLNVGGKTCLLADGYAPLQREDCCCRRGRVAGGMSWSRWEGLGSSAQVEGLVTSWKWRENV